MTAIHPGVWLKPRLLKRFGTLADASRELGYTSTGLFKVTTGERAMSLRLALTLQARMGYSAYKLLNMQLKHDLANLPKGDELWIEQS